MTDRVQTLDTNHILEMVVKIWFDIQFLAPHQSHHVMTTCQNSVEELNQMAAEDAATAAARPIREPCAICQQPMIPLTENLNAMECGHVFHDSCIRECWSRCNKLPGWCPMKCKDHVPTIQQLEEEDEMTVDAPQPTPTSEIPDIVIWEAIVRLIRMHGRPSDQVWQIDKLRWLGVHLHILILYIHGNPILVSFIAR